MMWCCIRLTMQEAEKSREVLLFVRMIEEKVHVWVLCVVLCAPPHPPPHAFPRSTQTREHLQEHHDYGWRDREDAWWSPGSCWCKVVVVGGSSHVIRWADRSSQLILTRDEHKRGVICVHLCWLSHMLLSSWTKITEWAKLLLLFFFPISVWPVFSVPAAPHKVSPDSSFSVFVRQLSALWLQSGSRQLSCRGWCHCIQHPQYDDLPNTRKKRWHIS